MFHSLRTSATSGLVIVLCLSLAYPFAPPALAGDDDRLDSIVLADTMASAVGSVTNHQARPPSYCDSASVALIQSEIAESVQALQTLPDDLADQKANALARIVSSRNGQIAGACATMAASSALMLWLSSLSAMDLPQLQVAFKVLAVAAFTAISSGSLLMTAGQFLEPDGLRPVQGFRAKLRRAIEMTSYMTTAMVGILNVPAAPFYSWFLFSAPEMFHYLAWIAPWGVAMTHRYWNKNFHKSIFDRWLPGQIKDQEGVEAYWSRLADRGIQVPKGLRARWTSLMDGGIDGNGLILKEMLDFTPETVDGERARLIDTINDVLLLPDFVGATATNGGDVLARLLTGLRDKLRLPPSKLDARWIALMDVKQDLVELFKEPELQLRERLVRAEIPPERILGIPAHFSPRVIEADRDLAKTLEEGAAATARELDVFQSNMGRFLELNAPKQVHPNGDASTAFLRANDGRLISHTSIGALLMLFDSSEELYLDDVSVTRLRELNAIGAAVSKLVLKLRIASREESTSFTVETIFDDDRPLALAQGALPDGAFRGLSKSVQENAELAKWIAERLESGLKDEGSLQCIQALLAGKLPA